MVTPDEKLVSTGLPLGHERMDAFRMTFPDDHLQSATATRGVGR